MERVGVVVHPTRHVLDAVEVVEGWTGQRGFELVQIPTGEQPVVASAGEVGACDLIVALGGDGTVLKALHASAPGPTPVLGVAYGSLGALTTVPTGELPTALDRFAAGDWTARELPALAVLAAGARVASAINDVVVARRAGTQLLVDVCVDGELYVRMAGDGTVVATPLGSSAYSMAAGGSLLVDEADAFVCTPVAMHGGCAPPVVVGGNREITLEVHAGHTAYSVDVDGFAIETEERQLAITLARLYATLVVFDQPRTAFPRLRGRGLISDSPRVLGQIRPAAQRQTES